MRKRQHRVTFTEHAESILANLASISGLDYRYLRTWAVHVGADLVVQYVRDGLVASAAAQLATEKPQMGLGPEQGPMPAWQGRPPIFGKPLPSDDECDLVEVSEDTSRGGDEQYA